MATAGGRGMVEKLLGNYDSSIGRAIESIHLENYTPIGVPSGVRGMLWRHFVAFGKLVLGTYVLPYTFEERIGEGQ